MLLENSIVEAATPDAKWFSGRSIFLGTDSIGRAICMPLWNQTRGRETLSMSALQNALDEGVLKIDSSLRPAKRDPKEL